MWRQSLLASAPIVALLVQLALSKQCPLAYEAKVLQCAHELIGEHYPASSDGSFQFELDHVSAFCAKYDVFINCTAPINVERCKSNKVLPSLSSLWQYICTGDFRKRASDEQSCYKAIRGDGNVKRCFTRTEVDLEEITGGSYNENKVCAPLKKRMDCYVEFEYFEKCLEAIKIQRNLYTHLIRNHTMAHCDLPSLDQLSQKFKEVQREREIGGCDEDGACHCIDGYRINNETGRCTDIDECREGVDRCSQTCVNIDGNYRCECHMDYYSLSEDNNHICIRNSSSDAPIWLLFAHGQSIWNVSSDGKHVEMKISGLEKTAMLDVDTKVGGRRSIIITSQSTESYDVQTGMVYYVDSGKNLIQRVNLSRVAKPETIQTFEADGVEGIAIDYIGRNVYTARKADIFVQTLDGKWRKRIYKEKLITPRALITVPPNGHIYGTDWSSPGFIYKAAMDGSRFAKIITTGVVWPNGLTVDVYAARIYWADAFLDVIESADLNGSSRRMVISQSAAVTHPFGLAIADDYIYWTDWNRRGILRASKLDGGNVTLLAQTTLLPYSVKVYHRVAQPSIANSSFVSDVCNIAGCSHLCLLTENATKGVCHYADGYRLDPKGGQSCKADCKNASNSIVCGGSEPKCVSKLSVCDGIIDCVDRIDELDCPERKCPSGRFQCRDNAETCLDKSKICDGKKECKDGSDEKLCDAKDR